MKKEKRKDGFLVEQRQQNPYGDSIESGLIDRDPLFHFMAYETIPIHNWVALDPLYAANSQGSSAANQRIAEGLCHI